MKENNCILSLFDEGSPFMGLFGRYSSGGAAYDRAIVLELFHGLKTFRRVSTKNRTCVKDPRLNICLLSHPCSFVKAICEEQESKEDGLMQRFLTNCPKPMFSSAQQIIEASKIERKMSLTSLLYVVHLIHHQVVPADKLETGSSTRRKLLEYSLSDEARVVFNTTYSEYRKICENMNEIDIFIRYVCNIHIE
jgi:hypothetical protein